MTFSHQQNSPERLDLNVGDEAYRVVLALPRMIPSLAALTFHTYFPAPGLEERLAGSTDQSLRQVFESAAQLRELSKNDLPYWESILAASWSTKQLDLLIGEALLHDSEREISSRFEISVNDLTADRIKEAMNAVPDGWVMAICSKARMADGSLSHIPMMDFRCPPSPLNIERIKVALKELGQTSGAVLESGRSYHFYGFEALGQDQWIRFLARSLLLAPLTDARYIAHRLVEGTAILRISSCKRKPLVPRVVEIL